MCLLPLNEQRYTMQPLSFPPPPPKRHFRRISQCSIIKYFVNLDAYFVLISTFKFCYNFFSSLEEEITPAVMTTVIFLSNSFYFCNTPQSFTIAGKSACSQIRVSNLSQNAHSHLHRRETPLLHAIPVPKLINIRKQQ